MQPDDDIGSSQPFAYTTDMSLTHSEADTGRGPWRRTLIQPVCIPNLHHTGIRSKFGEMEDPIMTSDGSVTKEYKGAINKRLRELPQMLYAADDRDMRRRDREKLCAKAASPDTTSFQIGSKVWSSGHAVRRAHAALHPPSSTALPDDSDAAGHPGQARTRRLNVDCGRRLKHPYNNASLLRSLLDLTFEPPEKPYGWAVEGVNYML